MLENNKKRFGRRILALALTFGIAGGVFAGFKAAAENISDDQPSWFFANSETNPHEASFWTCVFGKDGSFSKMEAREGDAGAYKWHPENISDKEYVGGYSLNSSVLKWAAMEYSVSVTGVAKSRPYGSSVIHAAGASAELIIVLKNGETGNFYPLYPTAGKWEWKILSGDYLNPDVANETELFKTAVKAGDKIYYVARPTGENEIGYVDITPTIDLTDDSSALSDYPANEGFSEWKEPEPLEEDKHEKVNSYISSWYINNIETNTADNDYPFSYREGTDGKYDTFLVNRDFIGENAVWKSGIGSAPWVGPWFASGDSGRDGVITFTAPESGIATVSSTTGTLVPEHIEDGADGFKFLIVQENDKGEFCPLYPTKGKWDWQEITETKSADLGELSTYIKAGEKIHFIVHSTGTPQGDVLKIDPSVSVTLTEDEELYPTRFGSFDYAEITVTEQDELDKPLLPATGDNNGIVFALFAAVLSLAAMAFINSIIRNKA